jgi:phosphoglycolate phosphatase
MSKFKVVLFNFNGTIVNTKFLAISIFNDIAKQRGYKEINEENIQYLSSLSVTQRCKALGVPVYQMFPIGINIKQKYQRYIADLEPAPGMYNLLQDLKIKGYQLGFITSNSRDVVKSFLINNSMDIFDYEYYSYNPFMKARRISNFLKKNSLDANHVLYVGDELRDINAAKRNHVFSIAVSWGYDSVDLLNTGHADYVAQKPEDILNIISER